MRLDKILHILAAVSRGLSVILCPRDKEDKMFIKKILGAAMALLVVGAVSATEVNAKGWNVFSKKSHIVQKNLKHVSYARKGGVLPPFAYIQFCAKHRISCANTSGKLAMKHGTVKLTNKLESQLASVNSRVNSRMRGVSDKGADKWAIGGKSGDCEDFALTKRAMLIAAGWPSRALSLTVVKTAWGEGHAVLSVRTSKGTLVLDNLARKVKRLKYAGYSIVSMQGSSSMQWSRRADL
jgi:predicted transglutaminase-like cysteine proteinase